VRWREEGRQRSRSFATKRAAVEFDRVRQRDEWRDLIAMPKGAVRLQEASTGTTFLVSEDLWDSGGDLRTGQRQIHSGFFRTIRDADAYRRQMPDADALTITVLYDRFPERDLTEAEIAAGEVDDSIDGRVKRLVAERQEVDQ
jgi:hypothetical protein